MIIEKSAGEKTKNEKGCLSIGLLIFSIIWIFGATIVAQISMWLMEQTIFEASHLFPDLRWLISLVYIIILSLPLIFGKLIINDPDFKKIFHFWTLLALSGLLFLPGRLIPINQAHFVSFSLIIGLLALMTFLVIIKRTHNKNLILKWKSEFIIIPVLFGSILSIPWVLWGALGSPLDLILNLVISIFAGFLLTILIDQLFIDLFPKSVIIHFGGKFLFGLVTFVGLIIFSTVFGQNSQQWMLVLTIPFTGWIISGLYRNVGGRQFNTNSIWMILSISISLPLIWFDPDEMSLIIGSGNGEILAWVSQSISYTVIISLVLIAVAGFLRNKLDKKVCVKSIAGLAVSSWAVVVLLYFFMGQTGFHGETLFVVMKDQKDLNFASTFDDPLEKRDYVYRNLSNFSIESQRDLINFLNKYNIPFQQFYLVNAIEIKGGPVLRFILENRDDVDRVLDNPILRPLPQEMPVNVGNYNSVEEEAWNLEMIGVNKVWEELGVKGEGIIIGQADSGVDGNHPALRNQYLGSTENNEYTWFDPWFQTEFPTDISGHGTHTLGTILGKNVGVAPDAKWIGCVNLGRNLGNPSYYLACMQFLLAPFPIDGDSLVDGQPALGAHILNNSWGCPEIEGCDVNIFLPAVSALRSAGIFVVSSAGNNGYYGCESITDPLAIYDDVFSVGAIDRIGELAPFSSLGPVTIDGSERIKPDLVAPGVDIFSTMPNASYSKLSGTSMAGPHIVGTVALMWSANPDLIGKIDLTEEILINTATQFSGSYPGCVNSLEIPNNSVGFGVVNAFHAVEEAIEIR
ncbi:MAG: S8 family serine peptidase [Anaerolineaceae bacterium]|nr:S8 family serine peptidase [Anaerolineaceae bacterium]